MKYIYPFVVFIVLTFPKLSAQSVQIPYFDDFESGAPGWVVENKIHSGTSWELGEPTTAVTNGAFSGNNCWDINLNTNYTSNAVCHLLSPYFDFSNVSVAYISFYTRFNTEYLWDYLTVQYTVNNGDTWSYMPFPFLEHPSGNSVRWIQSSLVVSDLSGFNNVQFKFTFTSDATINYDGYSIDDFRIETNPLSTPDLNDETNLISIFPNPATTDLSIVSNDYSNINNSISIQDISGKKVIETELTNSNALNLSVASLERGIFIVTYKDKNNIISKKLVLN